MGLAQAVLFAQRDLVDQAEHGLLDEFDQPLEHLRLAGEVPVERGFGDIQPGGQTGRGDFFATRLLQHAGQRLQDLHAALAGARALAGGRCGCFGGWLRL